MAPTFEPPLPIAGDLEATISGLAVHGTLPPALSGRAVGLGPHTATGHTNIRSSHPADGMLHAVELHHGRAVSYKSRWIITDAVARRLQLDRPPGPRAAGADIVAGCIVVFGGAILAFGDGSLAYELTDDLATRGRVDLAGNTRGIASPPRRDAATGDLHLLTTAPKGTQAHVVVSASAHTRTSRAIAGAPRPVTGLAVTRDHLLFATDGFIGLTSRGAERPITWIRTAVEFPSLVHAHDAGNNVVAHALTPSLERWTLHRASATVARDVLDPTPRRAGGTVDAPLDSAPHLLWTTGDDTVATHDLTTRRNVHHTVRPHRPSEFTFVADPARSSHIGRGWLVGFVRKASYDETHLIILDADDIAAPAIATVHIPRRVPLGVHVTWISAPQEIATASPCTNH